MKFYRQLYPFKIISFDLDDTLYDNNEVIKCAEEQFVLKLAELSQRPISLSLWGQWKQRIFQQNPLACEDVTYWRELTTKALLQAFGEQNEEYVRDLLTQTMAYFLYFRHRIDVPRQSYAVLDELRKRYPLVAITNGNVVPERIGLNFDFTLTGGVHGRAKPSADLFQQTSKHFGVQSSEILHIGDNLITDVRGAVQASCQAVWLNLSNQGINQFPEATLLPTLEISHLTELLQI